MRPPLRAHLVATWPLASTSKQERGVRSKAAEKRLLDYNVIHACVGDAGPCVQIIARGTALSRLRSAVMHEVSRLLDTGLDRATLAVLIELVESGVNPDALAHVVQELRREAAELHSTAPPPALAAQASEGEPSAGTLDSQSQR